MRASVSRGPKRRRSTEADAKAETIVVLTPFGRGNWATVELRIGGRRAPPPMCFAVGEPLELGGQRFRVSKIYDA